MKVLVVEDDQTVGRFVSRGLEEQRYHVDLVAEGSEGLERASASSYDVIVLDLRLPGMSGVEVLRTLRDRGVTTPVLVLTAQDAVESKVQALRTEREGDDAEPDAIILISQATYDQVRDRVRVDSDIPPLQAKGKAEPIQVYRVLEVLGMEV